MSLAISLEPILLSDDGNGGIRVGNTRVTLDTVIAAFNSGYTPEEIIINFDTLELADVYSVIGYYLRHKIEVDEYLKKHEKEATELQILLESRYDRVNLRERLLARKQQTETVN